MANVTYEGTNVLKYNIDGPSDPLGSNENDRFCKSVNGEAPDEVELWERNDPGPEACCEGPVMSSAKKPLKVDGQLQVDGRVENPVGIFNKSFGVYSKKPMVAEATPVTFEDTTGEPAKLEGTAAYWIGTPSGAIPMAMKAIGDPTDPLSELLVPAVKIPRAEGSVTLNSVWDAGKY